MLSFVKSHYAFSPRQKTHHLLLDEGTFLPCQQFAISFGSNLKIRLRLIQFFLDAYVLHLTQLLKNKYYLCLVSGDKFLSEDKLSNITGCKIKKANADECKEITGFSIGGVSPFAHINPPDRIFIDENLNRFEIVFAAAGHPYVVFGITFKKLCQISKGEIFNIVE